MEYDFLWWISMVGVGNAGFILGIAGAGCGLIFTYSLISNT